MERFDPTPLSPNHDGALKANEAQEKIQEEEKQRHDSCISVMEKDLPNFERTIADAKGPSPVTKEDTLPAFNRPTSIQSSVSPFNQRLLQDEVSDGSDISDAEDGSDRSAAEESDRSGSELDLSDNSSDDESDRSSRDSSDESDRESDEGELVAPMGSQAGTAAVASASHSSALREGMVLPEIMQELDAVKQQADAIKGSIRGTIAEGQQQIQETHKVLNDAEKRSNALREASQQTEGIATARQASTGQQSDATPVIDPVKLAEQKVAEADLEANKANILANNAVIEKGLVNTLLREAEKGVKEKREGAEANLATCQQQQNEAIRTYEESIKRRKAAQEKLKAAQQELEVLKAAAALAKANADSTQERQAPKSEPAANASQEETAVKKEETKKSGINWGYVALGAAVAGALIFGGATFGLAYIGILPVLFTPPVIAGLSFLATSIGAMAVQAVPAAAVGGVIVGGATYMAPTLIENVQGRLFTSRMENEPAPSRQK